MDSFYLFAGILSLIGPLFHSLWGEKNVLSRLKEVAEPSGASNAAKLAHQLLQDGFLKGVWHGCALYIAGMGSILLVLAILDQPSCESEALLRNAIARNAMMTYVAGGFYMLYETRGKAVGAYVMMLIVTLIAMGTK